MDREHNSDNKQIIYKLSLNNESLGLISPSLFVERLKERIASKLPNIKIFITYNPKDKGKALVELTCLPSLYIPNYQINNLQEEIASIAVSLRNELIEKIEDARRSVA